MPSSYSDRPLRPVSYIVLGLLATAGPQTSYELKRNVEVSVGFFWQFPHSQLYAEPQRLADLGLVAASEEAGGRRRRTFRITDEGAKALTDWLAQPAEASQYRDPALLRLFFSDAAPDTVVPLARRQIQTIGAALDFLNHPDMAPVQSGHRWALAWGRAAYRSELAFWHSVLEDLGEAAETQAEASPSNASVTSKEQP